MRDWFPTFEYGDTTENNIHEYVVPAQERWHIMSMWASLTTSNAGASVRQLRVALYVDSGLGGSDLMFETRPGLTQDSSLTYYYNLFPGAVDITTIRDTDYCSTPIPATLVLNPGWTIIIEDESSGDTDADDLNSKLFIQKTKLFGKVA